MRLHRLEMENLNSLRGSTVIDFDQGPLGETPLFLIHGPTGAGKSTLMDAVSLALFAATARLGRTALTRQETIDAEDPRNVMTRGTGSCLVRLVFSRLDGTRRRWFRAGWSVHRARGAPDGAFQNVKRELVELSGPDPDALLPGGLHGAGHKKADFEEAFAQALAGMTREDFQRTMLLAQGEFTAFLKAGRDDRSAILKRVVDTEHYRELGARAAARWRAEKERLHEREARLQGIELLNDEERARLDAENSDARSAVVALETEMQPLEVGRRWVEGAVERWSRLGTLRRELEAAREARTRREGDAKRLHAHRAVQPALRALDHRDGLRGKLDALSSSIEELTSHLHQAQELLEARRTAESQAQEARDRAREARAEAQPHLAEAREVAQRRAVLQAQKTDAEAALTSAHRALETARGARETQERLVAELRGRVASTRERWDAASDWHELAEKEDALAPVQSQVETFQGALRALADGRDILDRAQGKARDRARELNQARSQLRPLDEAVARAREPLPPGIEPQEAPRRLQELRAQRDSLADGIRLLEDLLESVASAGRTEERIRDLDREVEALRSALGTQHEKMAAAERVIQEIKAHLETARRSARREAEVLAHLAYHVKLQSELREGEPCAVCGSTAHPVRLEGPPPELAEAREQAREGQARAEEEVVRVEARLKEAEKVRTEAGAEEARTRTLLAGKVEELAERRSELDQLRESTAQGWRAAGGEGAPILEAVNAALKRLRTDREAAGVEEARWSDLDEAHRAWTEARAGIASQEAKYQAAQEAVQTAQEGVEAARSKVGEAREALAGAHASLPVQDGAPDLPVPDLPVEVWTGDDARAWLSGLRSAVRATRELRQKLDQAQMALSSGEQALEHRREVEEKAAREAEAYQGALGAAEKRLTAVLQEQSRYFDGRDPDAVAGRLDRQVADAQVAVDETARGRSQAESTWKTLEVTLRERTGQRAEVKPQIDEATRKSEDLLEAAGRSEEEARAARLPDLEASRLEQEVSKLDDALKDARSRHGEAAERWRLHGEARPDTEPLPEWEGDAPVEESKGNWGPVLEARRRELNRRMDEVNGRLSDARDRVTRLDERRRRDDDLRARRERELAELDEARREAAVWEELSVLIGTREGAAFEEFAQSLVLDRILAGANEHLKRLRPRYRFVRPEGSEGTFDFVVRDAHLAGQERPLTTLSGGETFLASLALALGLAGVSTQELPMETLLLDEGFGTLDPASLEDAINVLESLHERGYRVGLISHVEALRERIGLGIQVRPTGGGFSEVVVHGG